MAASTAQLVGPPELLHYTKKQKIDEAVHGLTENWSATYLTSTNPLLDFFFHIVPGTPADRVHDLLDKAWRRDPLTSLKLVAQLRGVKGTGKFDRNGFYAAAAWIYDNHPSTLVRNVKTLGQFGYLKDLLELLLRRLQSDYEIESKMKDAAVRRAQMKEAKKRPKWKKDSNDSGSRRRGGKKGYFARKGAAAREAMAKGVVLPPSEERMAADKVKGQELHKAALLARKERRLEAAGKALSMYQSDENYRALHDEVAQVFGDMLAKDMEMLKAGNKREISLAAKWCPSLDSSYDRSTLLCENIAKRLFTEQDGVNFNKYLEDVKSGKKKIASGALLPHEILESAIADRYKDGETCVAELQWSSMVEKLKRQGVLENSIAVCDVSGSMYGTPMKVCIALGMLLSELCGEPWKGRVITFSESPQIH